MEEKREIRANVRWMIRRDMVQVLEIERESFDFPWTEEDFIRCLRGRDCIGMVAEHKKQVLGFMIYELHRTRIELSSVAVADDMRRRSIGSRLIGKLTAKLDRKRRRRISTVVRETNLQAQLFFRERGFIATDIIRDFYDETSEDAFLMEYRK